MSKQFDPGFDEDYIYQDAFDKGRHIAMNEGNIEENPYEKDSQKFMPDGEGPEYELYRSWVNGFKSL